MNKSLSFIICVLYIILFPAKLFSTNYDYVSGLPNNVNSYNPVPVDFTNPNDTFFFPTSPGNFGGTINISGTVIVELGVTWQITTAGTFNAENVIVEGSFDLRGNHTINNLIVNSGGNFQLRRTGTIQNFTVNSGGIYQHVVVSSTLNGLDSDFPGTLSRTLGATSTVQIRRWSNNGPNPVPLPSLVYGNLTINLLSNSISGDWQLNECIQGVTNLTISNDQNNNIILSDSDYNLTISGNLSVGINGSLDFNNATTSGLNLVLNITGNASISNGGGFVLSNPNSTLTINFNNTAGNQTLTSSSAFVTNNINFNVNKTASRTLSLINNLNLSSSTTFHLITGTLIMNATAFFEGDGEFVCDSLTTIAIRHPDGIDSTKASGNFRNDIIDIHPYTNFTFSGTTGNLLMGTGMPAEVRNLAFSPTSLANNFVIAKDLIVHGTFNMTSTLSTIDVNPGVSLTVEGTMTIRNSGGLELLSDGVNANNTAMLINTGSISYNAGSSGSILINRFLTGSGGATPDGKGWYISSPLQTTSSAAFDAASGNRFFFWDAANTVWTEITDNATNLTVGRGYALRTGSDDTYQFNGSVNTGTINFPIISSGNKFNLIGNPYPCTIDWGEDGDHFFTSNNISPTIYFVDGENPPNYFPYNRNGGVGSGSRFIAPHQAFWVRVMDSPASLSCNNNVKVTQKTNLLKPNSFEKYKLTLKAIKDSHSDLLFINFDERASDNYDEFDSEKMFSTSTLIPSIYASMFGEKLCINTFNTQTKKISIPIGLKTSSGTISLSIDKFENFPAGTKVFIEDLFTNQMQEFVGTYSFNTTDIDEDFRLKLHFEIANTPTNLNEVSENESVLYHTGKTIFYNNKTNAKSNLLIYDLKGSLVHSVNNLNVGNNTIQLDLNSGMYLIQCIENEKIRTLKIVIP